MGIGPTQPAWEAGILPLNYTRKCVVIITQGRKKINDYFHFLSKKYTTANTQAVTGRIDTP